jgi:hypothetical protein
VVSIQENGDATWGFDSRWDMDFMEDLRALVAEPSDANRDMNALAGLIESGAGSAASSTWSRTTPPAT